MTDGTEFESLAEASLVRVKELNPNVKVTLAPGWTEDKVTTESNELNTQTAIILEINIH